MENIKISDNSLRLLAKAHPEVVRKIMSYSIEDRNFSVDELADIDFSGVFIQTRIKKCKTVNSIKLFIGENKLKPRELDIIIHLMEGMSAREISAKTNLSYIYVTEVCESIKTKFNTRSLFQLGVNIGYMCSLSNSKADTDSEEYNTPRN